MKYHPETPQDAAKYAVGRAAVERYVRPGSRLGLGSGTTSAWFVRALGERVATGLNVVGVPTSTATRDLALSLDIPLMDINDLDRPLDITLDGPDEIDTAGDMIKGGGACLLWERMVAEASVKMVCIADDTKRVTQLGAFPLPIEVVQFGWQATRRSIVALLTELGYRDPILRLRMGKDERPVITDSGNYILDAHLAAITDKAILDTALPLITGVVEHGLFTGIAHELLIASPDGSHDVIDLTDRVAARALRKDRP